jgi:hypothetical protein
MQEDDFVQIGNRYYQIREVNDNIYFLCGGMTLGQYSTFYLLVSLNSEVENEDDFDSAIVSMRETLLPNLQ